MKQVDEKLEQLLKDNNYFVVSKKSITWGLSILGTLLFGLWGVLQSGISNNNAKSDKIENALTTLVLELKEKKVEPLEQNVYEMKGDVKVLLDRTNSRSANIPTTAMPSNATVNTSAPPTN